jgi:thiol-disulfide isomerase/thioredoxin
VSPGLVVLAVALVAASAFGIYRRVTDGRIRGVESAPGRGGPDGAGADDPGAGGSWLTAQDLGTDLGQRATLVQFSTVFCQPCRPTRRLLAEVAAMVDGVRHVDVDAESHLDLVRRLDVLRTPTVLVLDRDGRVIRKAVGVPRKADLVAALGEAIG